MVSCPKILLLVFFSITTPVFVFAQNQDYLVVAGTLSNSQINLESVEQRVFSQSEVIVYKSGSYEARILKGEKIISNNFFEIVENPEIWVEVEGNKPEGRFESDKAAFNVKLPLNQEINIKDSVIEIWKGDQTLLRQKLSEVPLDIITAQNYPVSKTDESRNMNTPILYSIIAVALIMTGWLVWKWLKKIKSQTPAGVS